MTIETKTVLELGDIESIEFECTACHTKIVYPIEKYAHPPTHCSACQEPQQWLVHGADDYMDIDKLGRIIQRFGKTQNKYFVMRFGIANPKVMQ